MLGGASEKPRTQSGGAAPAECKKRSRAARRGGVWRGAGAGGGRGVVACALIASSMFATYLHAVGAIRATGAATPETSYYTPLENLLNAAGAVLKPTVRAVFQLTDLGAGRPDFGLFAAGQFERPADGAPSKRRARALPERGAGEVKSPAEPLDRLLAGQQVSKYWGRYRQVLVTNLRQFAFVA